MPKLHELLAVITDRTNVFKAVAIETARVFTSKPDLFLGTVKTTKAFDDSRSQQIDGTEYKELVTTVPERWNYTLRNLTDEMNVSGSIDLTNCKAKADLVVDGIVLAKDVPVATLLTVESKAKHLMEILKGAPTLQAGIAWDPAKDKGEHVFVSRHPVVRKKTEKVMTPVVLYAATDKHPAQVKEVVNDVPVGDITETSYSGMVSSAWKNEQLEKLQKLAEAAKQARMQANDCEVVKSTIGDVLNNFLKV